MKARITRRISRTILGLAVSTVSVSAAFAKTPLEGVWKLVERTPTNANAPSNANPQPGLYIFTGKHYSMFSVSGDKPRAELPQDLNEATLEQFRDAWRFTANSGTYDIKGNVVTTHPIVAKSPRAMLKKVAFDTFTFTIEGDMLTLTYTGTSDGPVANPTTVRMVRIE
jgi:hypothetical protein